MNRCNFLITMFAASLAATALAETVPGPSRHKTLFLDDHHVAEMTGLRRVMHTPEKKGVVFPPRGAADGIRVQTHSAPVWAPDEGVYKLFYMAFPYRNQNWVAGEIGSALATSTDGLHWKRPELGLIEIGGSRANNRFAVEPDLKWGNNKFMDVVYDPHDPDRSRRYKGLLGATNRRPVVSTDGVNWRRLDVPPIQSSDESTLVYDELRKRHIAIVKSSTRFGRSAFVTFSEDFETWSQPRLCFNTDERDQELALERIQKRLADPNMQNPLFNDPHPKTGWQPPGFDSGIGKSRIPTWRAETYSCAVFPYEGVYIGLPLIYYPTGPALPQRNNTVGYNEIHLAVSRDPQLRRENWVRLGNREPFIATSGLDQGLVGNFDRQQLGVCNRPLVMGDELWFYYSGAKGRTPPYKMWPDGTVRNQQNLTPEENADFDDGWIATCLARLRLDGFVSLTADDKAGQLITKPFVATGDRLLLNVDVHDGGEVRVEVVGKDGKPIRGFDLSSSVRLRDDDVDQSVEWRDKADWRQLVGKTVSLRIQLRRADLYAFWTKSTPH